MGPPLLQAAAGDLDRDAAGRLAREELQRHAYAQHRPSLLSRGVHWFLSFLGRAIDSASAQLPGGRAGLILLLLALGGAVALVVRLRPTGSRSPQGLLLGADAVTAAEHRLRAAALAGRGEFADAVRERMRALVRELEDRGVLEPRPSRTADEVAAQGGARVPAIRDDLRLAATVFDEIWYGGRRADEVAYASVTEIDRRVQAAQLVLA